MDLSPGYREAPAAGLACVWVSAAAARARRTRVLPDACTDVIWRRGDGAFVAGPDTAAEVVDGRSDELLLGARFATGTGAAVLGLPLHALRDQRVPLADVRPDLDALLPGDLDPRAALHVLRQLGIGDAAPDPAAATPADGPDPANLAAATPLRVRADPDRAVLAAAHALRDPHRRVARLAGDLGLSERQLRRRCEVAVGYGPKQLQRVLRLQAFLAAAEAPGSAGGLVRLALDTGYSDQSHLSTDCRRLTGLAPGALLRERAGDP